MSKFPTTENTEIFTMRISKGLKDKLYSLAKGKVWWERIICYPSFN
jgi:hypothetical protein